MKPFHIAIFCILSVTAGALGGGLVSIGVTLQASAPVEDAPEPPKSHMWIGGPDTRELWLTGRPFIRSNPVNRDLYLGRDAGTAVLTSGGANVAAGFGAMANIGTGSNNVAVGDYAMAFHVGTTGNTAVGASAMLHSVSCIDCTAVGYEAMKSAKTGVGGTAIGRLSLATAEDAGTNTGVGDSALRFTTGKSNVALGYRAAETNQVGNQNVYLGAGAALAIAAGNENTFVGYLSGSASEQKDDAKNSIAIGANTFTTENNQMVLGNDQTETIVLAGISITKGELQKLLALIRG